MDPHNSPITETDPVIAPLQVRRLSIREVQVICPDHKEVGGKLLF